MTFYTLIYTLATWQSRTVTDSGLHPDSGLSQHGTDSGLHPDSGLYTDSRSSLSNCITQSIFLFSSYFHQFLSRCTSENVCICKIC